MRINLLFLLCLLASSCALAKQAVFLEKGAQMPIKKNALSHVRFLDGRIKRIRGPKGYYTTQFDKSTGDLFFEPTALPQKPFNIFVQTANGANYLVKVVLKDEADQNIVLIPNGNERRAGTYERQSTYERQILTLLKDMWQHKTPSGYHLSLPKKLKRQSLGKMAYLYRMATVSGRRWIGTTYAIQNRHSHPICVKERYFMKDGVRAVALAQTRIQPYGKTTVLVIEERDHAKI